MRGGLGLLWIGVVWMGAGCANLDHRVSKLETQQESAMESIEELQAELTAVSEQLGKVQTEVRTELDGLKARIAELEAAQELPPEVTAALEDIKAKVAAIDALIPDAPPPAPEPDPDPTDPVEP